jgi:hypothetical protein
MVLYPRLELTIINSRASNANNDKIVVTPNSINGLLKKLGEKFTFGRSMGLFGIPNSIISSISNNISTFNNKPNDYNFNDDSIAPRQFEISFNKEKGRYYVVDNKKGTGIFVKIKNKIAVTRDMIISFCACHMVLQVTNEGM